MTSKTRKKKNHDDDDDNTTTSLLLLFNKMKNDPLTTLAVIVVLIGFILYEPINAANTISGVAFMAAIFLGYNKLTMSSSSSSSSSNKQKQKVSSSSSTSLNTRIKNIWEAGGSLSSSSTTTNNDDFKKSSSYSEKPFGSKYYYAHNNSSSTGGYKDGLKLEDYRMNGPRLLSKGGTPVVEEENKSGKEKGEKKVGGDDDDDDKNNNNTLLPSEVDNADNADSNIQQQQPVSQKITAVDPNIINITKYLWDDPGDFKGIAKILIDSLPERSSSSSTATTNTTTTALLTSGNYINWKDIGQPKNIEAKLVGEGLLVQIDTVQHGKYQLKISKLYGDANDVTYVVKSKRLIIKITKKKIATLSSNKGSNNLDAWPQPYRKI